MVSNRGWSGGSRPLSARRERHAERANGNRRIGAGAMASRRPGPRVDESRLNFRPKCPLCRALFSPHPIPFKGYRRLTAASLGFATEACPGMRGVKPRFRVLPEAA